MTPFDEFAAKASINNLEEGDLLDFKHGDETLLHKGAIIHADAIIKVGEVSETIAELLEQSERPVHESLEIPETGETLATTKAYYEFYQSLEAEAVAEPA